MAIDIQGMTEIPTQMFDKIANIHNPGREINKRIESNQEEKNKIFRYIGMELYEDAKPDLERLDFSRYPKLEVHLRKLIEIDEEIENDLKELAKREGTGGIACSCGNVMPKGSAFCSKCGKKLEELQKIPDTLVCSCGKIVKSDALFCPYCGNNLRTLKEGEATAETESSEIEYKECICGEKYTEGETMCKNCGRLLS